MTGSAFARFHPWVNFIYFAGAIVFSVAVVHPVCMAFGLIGAALFYILLSGRKCIRRLLGLLVLFIFITAINPLFNTYGSRVLFSVFGRPYTFEALCYGAQVAAMLVSMLLWFGCYNAVLTSDKFTALFSSLAPSLSLLLVMVFRMVPNFIKKGNQLISARRSIGKGAGETASKKEQLADSMNILSALTSWAFEGGIATSDSMKARGYGCTKRSSFMIYRFTARDTALLAAELILLAAMLFFALKGAFTAEYTPVMEIAPVSGAGAAGFALYALYMLLPSIIDIREDLNWSILRSKI